MTSLATFQLPRIDTQCRTTSIATSVESHVLRDRFWDAFAIDAGPGFETTQGRDNDAHGPSAYRGLSAVDRLRHLGSALYPSNGSVPETLEQMTPDQSPELAECNHGFQNLDFDSRDESEILVLPTARSDITADSPRNRLFAESGAVEVETDGPIQDSQPPQLYWASMFLNHWATCLDSHASTPNSSIVNDNDVQELDSATLRDFFENVRYFQSDHSTEFGLPYEIIDRPQSPKSKRPTERLGPNVKEAESMSAIIHDKRTTSSSDPAKKRWCGNWSDDSLMAFTFGSDCLRSMSR